MLGFVLRVAAWPLRIGLFFAGIMCAVATLGSFMADGWSWRPAMLLVVTGVCFEVRRLLD